MRFHVIPGILFVLLLALGLSGCQEMLQQLPFWPQEKVTVEEEATEEELSEDEEPEEGEGEAQKKPEPPKVYNSFKALPSTTIELITRNKLKFTGKLYDPWQARKAYLEATLPKPDPDEEELEALDEEGETAPHQEDKLKPTEQFPLLIFLHGAHHNGGDWAPYAWPYLKQGYAVLLLDMPGHGLSARKVGGGSHHWRLFSREDWDVLPAATEALLKYLDKVGAQDYPQLNREQTVLIGLGFGANTALVAAGRQPKLVSGVVALAPTLDLKGIEPPVPMLNFEKPIYFAASSNEPKSFDETERLYKVAIGPKTLRLYDNIGSGVDMLRFHKPLQIDMMGWIQAIAPPTPVPESWWEIPPPPPPPDEEE